MSSTACTNLIGLEVKSVTSIKCLARCRCDVEDEELGEDKDEDEMTKNSREESASQPRFRAIMQ